MPLPLLIAGAAAVAGTTGVVKGAKAISNNHEAKELIEQASTLCETAKANLEKQKTATTNSLQELGELRIKSMAEEMASFVREFGSFKNVQLDPNLTLDSLPEVDSNFEKKQFHMEKSVYDMKELAKTGAVALGAGAIVGIAVYGGVKMFGAASTGAAISALSGAAAKNATLAWLGGGAIKAGGLGMLGGKLVLGGVMIAPVLAAAGFIMEAKSKEKLANARLVYAEAEDSAEQINSVTAYLKGIGDISSDYSQFINAYGKKFRPFITELKNIRKTKETDEDGKIDFNSLSESEQKTLHLAWLMGQVYYQLLQSPILDDENKIDRESQKTLITAKNSMKELQQKTFRMNGDMAAVGNIFWKDEAQKLLIPGFALMGFLIAFGGLMMSSGALRGICLLVDAVIACPVFVKFRDLPESKKYIWRKARLCTSGVLMALILFLL